MPGLQKTNSNSFISNDGMSLFNDESVKEVEKIVLPKFYNEQGENNHMNLIIIHIEVRKSLLILFLQDNS